VTTELTITLGLLAAEVAAMIFFVVQSRKPPIPGRVRVFPYRAATVVTFVLILLTLAHLVSLLTGTQLQPRKPKGMR
jgi:hypothetical protein